MCAFRPAKLLSHGLRLAQPSSTATARKPSFLVSDSALDRKHLFDLVRLAAVDGGLAAFVVKRVDDHFEFTVAIQIKDGSDLIHVRSDRLVRLRIKLTGHKLRLNFVGDYASQNDDGITSRARRVYWRLGERRS